MNDTKVDVETTDALLLARVAADQPEGLAAALVRTVQSHPSHGIGYLDGVKAWDWQTYPELLDEAACILGGLRAAGLTPGDAVLFQLGDNRDFITGFWACILGGFVPVPLSPIRDNDPAAALLRRLINACDMLGRPLTLASPATADLLVEVANRETAAGLRVLPIAAARGHAPAGDWHRPHPDDLALLLLTSGSTGRPKAVRQSHRNLLAWASSVAPACGFKPAEVSLNWMPLDHVGGIVMSHLRDLVTGCRQFHGPTEPVLRDPLLWLDWMQATRATITWAPNFAFALVNEQAAAMAGRQWDLSAMWFIINGGEAIVSKTARQFLNLLTPHGLRPTAMRPAWGMSETCSGVTYSSSFALDSTSDADPFVSVGAPIPGIDIRIVDTNGRVVENGVIGRLEIKGISVTPGYHGDAEATRAAFTEDGWFVTGDLGVLRDGELTIAGREKDVIIVNGANYFCHEIEAIVEEIDGVEVSFTAACAVRPGGEDAEKVALFFVPKHQISANLEALKREIRRNVTLRAGVAPDYVVPLAADEVPKTAIGKIQRGELRSRFESGAFAGRLASRPTIRGAFRTVWRPASDLPPSQLEADSNILVIARKNGIGERLGSLLQAAGHRVQLMLQAPHEDDRQQRVALARADGMPSHIIHALAHGDWPEPADQAALRQAQAAAAVSLLRLLQAVEGGPGAVRILVVTSGALPAGPGLADIAKFPMAGLVRTIAHESDTVRLANLDLPANGTPLDVDAVLAELGNDTTGVVALRDGKRLVATLEPASPGFEPGARRVVEGGLYLMSGGTGDVGRALARRLVQRHGAKLVVLGRRDVAPDGLLQELDEHAIYLSGDIADAQFARSALTRGQAQWGRPLAGIFHLAGSYHEAPLAAETEQGLLDAVSPKLAGAWALHQVARDHPDCLFVSFSSLLGHFGAFGTGAYAAANAALDAFSTWQCAQGLRSYSIAWSMWHGLGMARLIDPEVPKRRGFQILEAPAALDLLEQVLDCPPGHYLVGLDPTGRSVGGADAAASNFRSDADVPPATELQARLVHMWQDILRLPSVGITASFFDLGGSSLLAARLFSRIEKELGASLPIATLYSSPTITGLSEVIENLPGRRTPSCLLTPLQPLGSGHPVFCISGVGSDAIAFQELADTLGDSRPFYGLQVSGIDGTPLDGEIPTLEKTAGDLIEMIGSIQPSGPCHVAGHCFGSLLAWEVARQLQIRKREIGMLALIDPVVSTEFPEQMVRRGRLRYSWQQFRKMAARKWLSFAWEKMMNVRRYMLIRQRLGHSIATARTMYEGYRPQPFAGHVTVFLASQSFFNMAPNRDPRRDFERIAEHGVTYIQVTGDHDSMLRRPGAVELAAGLRSAIDQPAASNPG